PSLFLRKKCFPHRRPSLKHSWLLNVAAPNRRQTRQHKKRREIPQVIGSVHLSPTGSIFVSVVVLTPRSPFESNWAIFALNVSEPPVDPSKSRRSRPRGRP